MMQTGDTYIIRLAPSAFMVTLQPPRTLLILLLAMVLVFVLAAGCSATAPSGGTVTPTPMVTIPVTTEVQPPPTTEQAMSSCTMDSDCVPAQCCHPTGCINKAFKGVCNLLCTNVCSGPLDCGAGHCGCVSGTCQVIAGP
jgi:hypothetical protein